MDPFGLALAIWFFLVTVACAVVAVVVGKRPRSRSYVVQAAMLGALAGLAPIALVLFLRLSLKTCAVLNILGLPWAEPWREAGHWAGVAVWLASTAFIIFAFVTPSLRRAGIAMSIWSAVAAMPTFVFFFLILYGDPAANCVPV